MKQELPKGVVIGAIVVLAIAVIAVGFVVLKGPPAIEAPKIKAGEQAVPEYIKNMPPEMRKMAEEQMKEQGVELGSAKPEDAAQPNPMNR